MINNGPFYANLTNKRQDSPELKVCIEEAVSNILNKDTDFDSPGMLLGRIQSGKTRAFIGIVALAFDNNYDIAIILTKGTIALAEQTYKRLKRDFADPIGNDQLQIYDILNMPQNLPRYVLQQKIIFVVKKQADNLERVINAIETIYPDLIKKNVLIIDDEADYASLGFKRVQKDVVQINKIATQINSLRNKVLKSTFFQVTATPYSLYLQPEKMAIPDTQQIFKPIRPAFTVLLPKYEEYIGGDFYFEEFDNDTDRDKSISAYIYEEVSLDELDILKKEDRRSFRIEETIESKRIIMLRKGLMNFIVGACIRRIQQKLSGEREGKYSFVVHTEYNKTSHAWQEQIVSMLVEQLIQNAVRNTDRLKQLVQESIEDLSRSLKLINQLLPKDADIFTEVISALTNEYLIVNKVNSENDVKLMLDDKGQLKLLTPLNIFIGGQILDRGLTIDNLIGFYYGRRPGKFQQDTVLQHSRMYGSRNVADLAVTRFYTANTIYGVLKRINEFDSALREAFEKDAQEAGIVFIRKDPLHQIRPCSPNKILLSAVTTLKPYKRLLPVGFQTDYKTNIKSVIEELDSKIAAYEPPGSSDAPFTLDLDLATSITDIIQKTFEKDFYWDVDAFKASMEYLSRNTSNTAHSNKVWCIVRRDRKLKRFKADGTFSDAPDTAQTEGALARKTAIDIPMLMLFRQNGLEQDEWRGTPFWWPVLYAPANTRPVIFAGELVDD